MAEDGWMGLLKCQVDFYSTTILLYFFFSGTLLMPCHILAIKTTINNIIKIAKGAATEESLKGLNF